MNATSSVNSIKQTFLKFIKSIIKPKWLIPIIFLIIITINLGEICLMFGLYFKAKGLENRTWNEFFKYGAALGSKECCYEFSEFERKKSNFSSSRYYVEKAAQLGHAKAQVFMMIRINALDTALSRSYATKASQQGEPIATMALAKLKFDEGHYQNALHYLTEANRQNSVEVYSYLGRLAELGFFGSQHKHKALSIYLQGRKKGDGGSNYRLGLLALGLHKSSISEKCENPRSSLKEGLYYLLQASVKENQEACYLLSHLLSEEAQKTNNQMLRYLSEFYFCLGHYSAVDKLSSLQKIEDDACWAFFEDWK